MTYEVRLLPKAVKFMKALSVGEREKVTKRLQDLAVNPRNESVIKLTNMDPAQYRARQGDYRILFTIQDKQLIVEVIDIKNRKNAY